MTKIDSKNVEDNSKSSSRIIIKNIPSYLSEKRLKDHISSIGCNITDVKIVKKKTEKGKSSEISRRFCFVGFYSDEDAKKAIDYFDGTFIDTSRITVQFAFPPGSELIPRPWSKYSIGSSQYNKINMINETNNFEEKIIIQNKDETEIKKLDFKKWISNKTSNKSWLDSVEPIDNNENNNKLDENFLKVTQEIVKPTKAGISNIRKHIQFSDDSDSELNKESNIKNLNDNDTSSTNISDSDLQYDDNNELNEKELNNMEIDNLNEKIISPKETSRLMVVNISYSTVEDDLRHFFSNWGEVKDVTIIRSSETGVSKGYGFIKYEFVEHAIKALSSAHLSLLHGRILRVYPAFEKPTKDLSNSLENDNKIIIHSNYKLKALKKKKETSLDQKTWNLLYISGNSAVNSFLNNENLEKHDIINIESPDLASRVSLIETHIITATKEWLKKEGISVKAFEVEGDDIFSAKLKFEGSEKIERSRDTIIIKHLPSEQTTLSDLQKICSPFGQINRLCLSPSKTIAIVQYLEESSANFAFKKIAFKRFKGVPLYVEWAPINLFISSNENDSKLIDENSLKIQNDDDLNNSNNDIANVFVKNINFDTTEASLEKLFGKLKGFRKATITTHSHSNSEGKIIKKSMGYGFLEFSTNEDAKECIKKMQSIVLDGHSLQLKLSTNSKSLSKNYQNTFHNTQSTELGIKNPSNKLLIKNLPFQASKSDILSLFSSIGTVTAVRIPKKSDGTNKGYCFVEFLGKLEAIAALEQFQHTHLYGRHLIIEIAQDHQDSPLEKKNKI